MSIPIGITPITIPAQQGKFTFRVQLGRTISPAELARQIMVRTARPEGEILAVIAAYEQVILAELLNANMPALGGMGYLRLTAEGVAERPDTPINNDTLTLQLGIIPHKHFLEQLRNQAQYERIVVPVKQPIVTAVVDRAMNLLDVIAPGELCTIRGDNLLFEDKPEEGVFFQAGDAPEIRMNNYGRTGDTLLEVIFPELEKLIVPTGWQVKVKSSYGNKATGVRTTVYDRVVWRRPVLQHTLWPTDFVGTKGIGKVGAYKTRQNNGSLAVTIVYESPGDIAGDRNHGAPVAVVPGTTSYTLSSDTVTDQLTVAVDESSRQALWSAIPDPGMTPGEAQTIFETFTVR